MLIPYPQRIIPLEGVLLFNGTLPLMVESRMLSEYANTVKTILESRYGIRVPVIEKVSEEPAIRLSVPTTPEVAESYRLAVKPDGILLEAHDERGFRYGSDTLGQLLASETSLLAQEIQDWPDFDFRGLFLTMRLGWTDPEVLKRVIDKMARYRLKMLVIELNEGLEYRSHPEVSAPWAMSQTTMREIIRFARKRDVLIWPLVQSLHHVEYILATHPELMEEPGTYCPAHPDTLPLMFDLFDEVIELFEPEYLHIGHDEVVTDYETTRRKSILQCPRCRGKDPADWFADEVITLYDFLSSRGVKTMMWGDELLNQETPKGRGGYGGPPDFICRCINRIPRDIALCDWHYNLAKTYSSVPLFQEAKFENIIGCPWKEESIYFFSRFAAGLPKRGLWGMMDTNWNVIDQSMEDVLLERVKWSGEFFWTAGRSSWTPEVIRSLEIALDRPNPLRDIESGTFHIRVPLEQDAGGATWLTQSPNVRPEGWVLKANGRTESWHGDITAAQGHTFEHAEIKLSIGLFGGNRLEISTDEGISFHPLLMDRATNDEAIDLTPWVEGQSTFRLRFWARNDTNEVALILSEFEITGKVR